MVPSLPIPVMFSVLQASHSSYMFANFSLILPTCTMNCAANRFAIFYIFPLLPLQEIQNSCTLLFMESKRQKVKQSNPITGLDRPTGF
jgi:hypothetical protein